MRRSTLLVLLGLGALLGFGSGFHQLRWYHLARRDAFERHVAQICTDAARAGWAPEPGPRSGPGPRPGW